MLGTQNQSLFLLTEPGSPSEASTSSGLPSEVRANGTGDALGLSGILLTNSSHFSEIVRGGYPETALKRFCLPGTARAQE